MRAHRNTARSLIAALVAISAHSATQAQTDAKQTPLDAYRGTTQFLLITCPIKFKMAALQAESGTPADEKGDFRGCIQTGRTDAKAAFDKAIKTVKKASARESLKTYHVAFVGALDGIEPGSDERKFQYSQRQQALQAKVEEAWTRFELEQ